MESTATDELFRVRAEIAVVETLLEAAAKIEEEEEEEEAAVKDEVKEEEEAGEDELEWYFAQEPVFDEDAPVYVPNKTATAERTPKPPSYPPPPQTVPHRIESLSKTCFKADFVFLFFAFSKKGIMGEK